MKRACTWKAGRLEFGTIMTASRRPSIPVICVSVFTTVDRRPKAHNVKDRIERSIDSCVVDADDIQSEDHARDGLWYLL